ncbi:hypothetical protein BJ508DRAFT_335622 [Ascobolus immersus RN42]|uniref:Uncharacterized protein n=1 Tax=Ascobolus immersus RN42 TaxID=1160509 RepID=A0A3N4HQ98_ASCIM|nr:hypothetical protein BJ508DRAFT_335622 [Ascobolus immersus RN42]
MYHLDHHLPSSKKSTSELRDDRPLHFDKATFGSTEHLSEKPGKNIDKRFADLGIDGRIVEIYFPDFFQAPPSDTTDPSEERKLLLSEKSFKQRLMVGKLQPRAFFISTLNESVYYRRFNPYVVSTEAAADSEGTEKAKKIFAERFTEYLLESRGIHLSLLALQRMLPHCYQASIQALITVLREIINWDLCFIAKVKSTANIQDSDFYYTLKITGVPDEKLDNFNLDTFFLGKEGRYSCTDVKAKARPKANATEGENRAAGVYWEAPRFKKYLTAPLEKDVTTMYSPF